MFNHLGVMNPSRISVVKRYMYICSGQSPRLLTTF